MVWKLERKILPVCGYDSCGARGKGAKVTFTARGYRCGKHTAL